MRQQDMHPAGAQHLNGLCPVFGRVAVPSRYRWQEAAGQLLWIQQGSHRFSLATARNDIAESYVRFTV